MDINRAVELICETMQVVASIDDTEITFTSVRRGLGSKTALRNDLESAIEDLKSFNSSEETQIFHETAAEFLVTYTGPARPSWARADLEVTDGVDGYQYRLGKPSLAFALFIADKISDSGLATARKLHMNSSMFHRRFVDSDEGILDFFIDSLRLSSLRITSLRPVSQAVFQALADSFYFHVGFNLDYPVVPKPTLEESIRRRRIQYLRRGNAADLDAPHKKYIPDLVHNYQLALSTDSPMLSYLSYYHVAEHWFEEVFQNDIAVKLQGVITSPGFSYRRMKDLRRLIKTVSDELKTRDEEVIINEQSALKMTLIRYVNIPELVNSLDAFDPSLIGYYASGAVAFSGGQSVNLREAVDDKLYARLAGRIYKTRNALVHRKNGAKSRFAPFRDDHALDPEVPMMRFIAEQIIVSSATV